MKKIKFLSLVALMSVGAIFLSNCGTGETVDAPKPLLNFIADSNYVSANSELAGSTNFSIAVTASHDSKIKSLTVTKAINGGAAVIEVDSAFDDKSIPLFVYSGTTGADASVEVYTFTVADKDGNSTSKSITITNLGNKGLDLLVFEKDNNQETFKVYNFKGPLKGAYELGGGPLSISDPNSGKDIQDSTLTGETWPARWTSRNGSTFKKVSGDKWNTIANDATIEAAWAAATGETSVINLNESDVYLINIKGSGKLGLVLITSLDRTVSKSEFAQFVYKLQQ
jgi:hypothetical protein